MPDMQTILADAYHTTEKPDDCLDLRGEHHVVGIDITPGPKPNGRFIYFSLDNPANGGTVLRGETFCDYRTTDMEQIRARAIAAATLRFADRRDAEEEVDRVIAAGGILLPSSAPNLTGP